MEGFQKKITIINVLVIIWGKDNRNKEAQSHRRRGSWCCRWLRNAVTFAILLCNRWLQRHLTYFHFLSIFPLLLTVIFPYSFSLSVLVVTLSPGSGKNGRTKRRREQGSLGVWAGGFVGQPAGHTKRVRTREREKESKRGMQSQRGVSATQDMGVGAAEARGRGGGMRRGTGWTLDPALWSTQAELLPSHPWPSILQLWALHAHPSTLTPPSPSLRIFNLIGVG